MPNSFASSFWTQDYTTGVTTLYNKLYQGCIESDQFLSVVKSKAACELEYGRRVYNIKHDHKPTVAVGFGYDEGEDIEGESSLKNSFFGLINQISNEGQTHLQIAENLTGSIVKPFEIWSKGHRRRLDDSKSVVDKKIKEYNAQADKVEKLKNRYFAKCREFEVLKGDMTQEEVERELNEEERTKEEDTESESNDTEDDNEDQIIQLGPIEHTPELLKETLQHMLVEIKHSTIKVTLLGTYPHTVTGIDISTWLQKNLSLPLSQCEEFGQDLLDHGFIRKVNTSFRDGLTGANFISSKSYVCQWRPQAYTKAGLEDPFAIAAGEQTKLRGTKENRFGSVNEYFDGLKSQYLEERTLSKVNEEMQKLDCQYLTEVLKLDVIQCALNEVIVENMKAVEAYEKDRIEALKRVILDYSTFIRSSLTQLEDSTAKILTFREAVNVVADISLTIANYETGRFKPHVTLYDNYHKLNKPELQLFGTPLTVREKYEGKPVSLFIGVVLQYLSDETYPSLKTDQERVDIWFKPTPLKQQNQLRNAIQFALRENLHSESPLAEHEVITKYLHGQDGANIVSALKIYLLSLPVSLIPQSEYDLLKSLYFQHSSQPAQRHASIASVIGSLPTSHLKTLKVLLKHLVRIGSIIKASDKELHDRFFKGLSIELAPVLLWREEKGTVLVSSSAVDSFVPQMIMELLTVKELTSEGKSSVSRVVSRAGSAPVEEPKKEVNKEEIKKGNKVHTKEIFKRANTEEEDTQDDDGDLLDSYNN